MLSKSALCQALGIVRLIEGKPVLLLVQEIGIFRA